MTPALPFAEGAQAARVAEAIALLQEHGYRVTPPPPSVGSVTKIADVIELFYTTMSYYHPGRKMHYAASAADRQVISSLLSSRQATGLSRKRAYSEVCRIIKALFKYEQRLALDSPIASVRILSSSWIIDRVLSFLNGEDKSEEEASFSRVSSSFSSKYVQSEEYLSKTGQLLDSMHERVVTNGSKSSKQKRPGGIPHPKGSRSGN